jgi:hypothetical protein
VSKFEWQWVVLTPVDDSDTVIPQLFDEDGPLKADDSLAERPASRRIRTDNRHEVTSTVKPTGDLIGILIGKRGEQDDLGVCRELATNVCHRVDIPAFRRLYYVRRKRRERRMLDKQLTDPFAMARACAGSEPAGNAVKRRETDKMALVMQ